MIKNQIYTRKGTVADLDDLIRLNHKWHKLNLETKENGFLSVSYERSFFEAIITNEDILVFECNNELVGYVLVNTVVETEHITTIKQWFYEFFPMYLHKNIAFSCQILLDETVQGTGFLYIAQKQYMAYFSSKYELLVSTISKENPRSVAAHQNKDWKFIELNEETFLVYLDLVSL